jgi:hypothetical protein
MALAAVVAVVRVVDVALAPKVRMLRRKQAILMSMMPITQKTLLLWTQTTQTTIQRLRTSLESAQVDSVAESPVVVVQRLQLQL